MGIPDHLTCSWESCMQIKKQQLKLDMEQQTSSISGKGYVKAVYCHSAYLTYMQSTSCEMPGWTKHNLESRLLGEIAKTSDMQVIPLYGRKWRKTKEPLDESERGEWKNWLKTQHSETKIMASGPITSWQIDGEAVETLLEFILGGSKITADGGDLHCLTLHCVLDLLLPVFFPLS